MKAIISIDLGTTHIKTVAFSPLGCILSSVENKTPILYSNSAAEIDSNKLWDLVRKQLNLVANNQMHILGITLTGMAEAGVVYNQITKNVVTPIMPWFDKRTISLSSEISLDEANRRFAYSGLRNSYKYGIYKFVWCLDYYNLEKKNMIWLSVADYIAWKLTSEVFTDETLAARTFVYDIRRKEWNTETLDYYELTTNNFPRIIKSGQAGGYLLKDVLEYTHLEDVIVSIGGHDHFCCSFGVLYENEEALCNSIGTAETFIGITKGNEFDISSGLVYGPYVDDKIFYLGNISSAGMAVEWFLKEFDHKQLSYDQLNTQLKKSYIKPTDILFFPFLSGIGTPEFSNTYKGAFLGLTQETTHSMMLQSIFEGVSFQEKVVLQCIDKYESNKSNIIYTLGGGSKNPTWMQIKANVLDKIIHVTKIEQATCFGAAALHIYKNSGRETTQTFLQSSRTQCITFSPDTSFVDVYNDIYEFSYKSLYQIVGNQMQLGGKNESNEG